MTAAGEDPRAPEGGTGPAAAEGQAEPSGVRLALTLGFAGLLAGLILVGVYQATLPRIEANKARALRQAIFKVVPGAKSTRKLVWSGGKLVPVAEGDKRDGVYAAYGGDGKLVGYALVGEGPGFQDAIRLIFGYDPQADRIVGMHVLDSRETPGLGDKIFKDPAFVGAFKKLAVKPEVMVVKKGKRSKPNQVDAITGATISSKAVVKIINRANRKWLGRLPRAGEEPEVWRRAATKSVKEPRPGGR